MQTPQEIQKKIDFYEDAYTSEWAKPMEKAAIFGMLQHYRTELYLLNKKNEEQHQREHPETMTIYHPDYMRARVHEMD